jgi:hypothetical protein
VVEAALNDNDEVRGGLADARMSHDLKLDLGHFFLSGQPFCSLFFHRQRPCLWPSAIVAQCPCMQNHVAFVQCACGLRALIVHCGGNAWESAHKAQSTSSSSSSSTSRVLASFTCSKGMTSQFGLLSGVEKLHRLENWETYNA